MKPPVHTICIGQAMGTAAMILSAGTKGHRAALPLIQRGLRDADPQVSRLAAAAMERFRGRSSAAQPAAKPPRNVARTR